MSEIIHVGTAPPGFAAFADYLDGERARVQRVALSVIENTRAGPVLGIEPAEGEAVIWPLADVRRLPDQAGTDGIVLGRDGRDPARLILRDADAATRLAARCPDLSPPRPGPGLRRRLAMLVVGAVASVAVIIFVLVPALANQLATMLPPEGAKALGDATFRQIRVALDGERVGGVRLCEDAPGAAALAALTARFTGATELPYPLSVHVLDHEMVNAFALPGGHVILFNGLIQAAERPEEVAAVMAHEIGHVAARDPSRIALRSAGSIGVLGLLLGDFAGGTAVLFLTERLISASYSREAEAGADTFAHALMLETHMPPSALASMFRRLRAEHGDAEGITAHFASHPALGDRIAAAEEAEAEAASRVDLRPAMSDAEWQALRAICGPQRAAQPGATDTSDVSGASAKPDSRAKPGAEAKSDKATAHRRNNPDINY